MALNQLTVLANLPTFSGNSKAGEVHDKSSINVETFFKTLNNYFTQNNVVTDANKFKILYFRINMEKGDAVDVLEGYADKYVTFKEVEADFMSKYLKFTATEFRDAARTMLDSKLDAPANICGMTRLESQSRAVVEAYLHNSAIENQGINGEKRLEAEIEDENQSSRIYLLQKFCMHLMMSTKLSPKIYEEVAKNTQATSSKKLRLMTVEATERYNLKESYTKQNNPRIDPKEAIYNIQKPSPNNKGYNPYANTSNVKNQSKPYMSRERRERVRCCAFFRILGHDTQ
jgi:hypothetical protein